MLIGLFRPSLMFKRQTPEMLFVLISLDVLQVLLSCILLKRAQKSTQHQARIKKRSSLTVRFKVQLRNRKFFLLKLQCYFSLKGSYNVVLN